MLTWYHGSYNNCGVGDKMKLSELVIYAEEKFNIKEKYKWQEFQNYSVLIEPDNGKWIALLMRHRDFETGENIEFCDIKCGQEALKEIGASYLSKPFKMKGNKWLGVKFGENTEKEVVYKLFDRAMGINDNGGKIILEDVLSGIKKGMEGNVYEIRKPEFRETVISHLQNALERSERFGGKTGGIPEKIRQMHSLYVHGDGSLRQKCKNFYIQGKFMEDYEDEVEWQTGLSYYFPTYHDMRLNHLRGYFSWRTKLRCGDFRNGNLSYSYMYLYELLNGIGVSSVLESLIKMREFENFYMKSENTDRLLKNCLSRWKLELAVLKGVESEIACEYADEEMIKKDRALAALEKPDVHTDEEIFEALCLLGTARLASSAVVKKQGSRGVHLFAEVWRVSLKHCNEGGKTLITACFGGLCSYIWHPLSNAMYYSEEKRDDEVYHLNEVRSYIHKGGRWVERGYHSLHFDKEKFNSLLREADRRLRLYLNTGSPLKEREDGAWAAGYIDMVIEKERKEQLEAAKPKISIRFDKLDEIRKTAAETGKSLLTEEEREEHEKDKPLDKAEEKQADKKPEIRTENAGKDTEATATGRLSSIQTAVIKRLLEGENPVSFVKENRIMPEIIADEINEIFFEEVGDNVLECDGENISLIEDYRAEIERYLHRL